ncbi:Gp19/Gp15/Gp42 family protein [Adlercreutzia sp. ZJ141]|uniref:Gp19/Gp15/Gp42 family protein n=1 Tax=Adlercreutzia sp. ZJ141 TaxID=2709406 RepID=UPI0013EC8D6B|nr:Gp19/Gp15/Gp42 family protein [Adlercreutzia sp. ZJ141]
MEPFASAADYAARYGEVGDTARMDKLLADATAKLLSEYESFWGVAYEPGVHAAFDRGVEAACCLLVNQVLAAPAQMAGATQYSQGAGGYTASVTYGSALGSMYVSKSMRASLGLDGQIVRSMHPIERNEVS